MQFEKLLEQCPKMCKFQKQYGLPEIGNPSPDFNGIVNTIISQLLSTKAAKTIYNRTISTIGKPTPQNWLNTDFDILRGCGLSGAKINSINAIANDIVDGKIDLLNLSKQPSDEICDVLIKYKGIGNWTAKGFALMQCHKQDIFLSEDLGVRDGVQLLLGLSERPSIEYCQQQYEQRWHPHGGSATILLWHFKTLDKLK